MIWKTSNRCMWIPIKRKLGKLQAKDNPYTLPSLLFTHETQLGIHFLNQILC